VYLRVLLLLLRVKEDVLVAAIEKKIALMENDFQHDCRKSDLDEAAKLNSMINRFISISSSGKAIHGLHTSGKNAALQKKLMKARPFARIAAIMARVIFSGCEKRSPSMWFALRDLLPPPHDDRICLSYVLSE